MMNPKSTFETDNRGVSPVIGVILMVAITVILAAVIGTFVLNLGGDLQQTPQAQISISTGDAPGDGTVKISHNGGDTLQNSQLTIEDDSGNTYTPLSGDQFTVGNSDTFDPTPSGEVTLRVVHEPSDSILVETTVSNP